MNIGVIADVHGNKPALKAVLNAMPPVDTIVNAGDVVGYNPWPADCVAHIREQEMPTVMGNHDRAVAAGSTFRFNELAKAGVEHARDRLDSDQQAWLSELPDRDQVLDGRLRIVHGHPEDPDRYTYPAEFSPELLDDEEVLVMGHTHVQHAETYPEGVVVNPGSVGQPRDGDPRAAFAVVDPAAHEVDLHRVSYDIDRVIDAVKETGLPEQIGTRLLEGQ